MLKRSFDILLSGFGLLVFWPLLAGITLAIKATSPGPIFYRGVRVGRGGKPFRIFKFRSMVINADKIGGSSTGDHDPRITSVGRLLRKCKLDELPQLFNVFSGDMSFVGPRPEVQQYVDLYTEDEKAILTMRPGITDWASIWNSDEGAILAKYPDPDKAYEEIIRPTKLKLQLLYVHQNSLAIDLKILFYTFLKIVRRNVTPREITELLAAQEQNAGTDLAPSYATVTELPGHGATKEQISMIHTRYHFAAQLAKGKEVLELACGPGIALGYLAQTASRVAAGDFDPTLVEAAIRQYGSKYEIHRMDAQNIPYPDNSFDVILLLEAIYYLPEPERFVAEARRVLRKDGVVFVCSANRERPDFNASPYTHHYFSAAELQRLLAAEGFAVNLYGSFPVESRGLLGRTLGRVRLVAVKFGLIPKTMAWKILLKRMLYGRLDPIPSELHVDENKCQTLKLIQDPSKPVVEYKVIYATGRRAA